MFESAEVEHAKEAFQMLRDSPFRKPVFQALRSYFQRVDSSVSTVGDGDAVSSLTSHGTKSEQSAVLAWLDVDSLTYTISTSGSDGNGHMCE